jgi:hypothetical protein
MNEKETIIKSEPTPERILEAIRSAKAEVETITFKWRVPTCPVLNKVYEADDFCDVLKLRGEEDGWLIEIKEIVAIEKGFDMVQSFFRGKYSEVLYDIKIIQS